MPEGSRRRAVRPHGPRPIAPRPRCLDVCRGGCHRRPEAAGPRPERPNRGPARGRRRSARAPERSPPFAMPMPDRHRSGRPRRFRSRPRRGAAAFSGGAPRARPFYAEGTDGRLPPSRPSAAGDAVAYPWPRCSVRCSSPDPGEGDGRRPRPCSGRPPSPRWLPRWSFRTSAVSFGSRPRSRSHPRCSHRLRSRSSGPAPVDGTSPFSSGRCGPSP